MRNRGMTVLHPIVKALARRPWYAASIVVVMAIATALLTSVLAIVDGVLFKPLGYPGERELVAIKVSSSQSRSAPSVDQAVLSAWVQAAPQVAFTGFRHHSRTIADIQPNFFEVMGVRPALGGFAPEDFEGTPLITPRILSDEIFRSQFGADPSAIGRVVILDPTTGSGYRVAGVMPRGFVFPVDRFSIDHLAPFGNGPFRTFSQIIARVPPSVTPRELEARVVAAGTTWDASRQSRDGSPNVPIDQVKVEPLGRALGAASRPLFLALLVAAVLLVGIAALNASSLMAARSVDRRRELAVRRALGASSLDIAQLLITEAGLLVGTGAALGLVIAAPLLQFASGLLPEDLTLFRTTTIDGRVAAFSVAATVVLTCVVAIWPLRLVRGGDTDPGRGRAVTGQARSLSWRMVVTMQVALALVLTIGGSLLVGSLLSVYARTQPIATENVQTIGVQFLGMSHMVGHMAPERGTRVAALLERVRAVPGVEAVALTAYNLLEHAYEPARFKVPSTAIARVPAMVTHAVTGDFYRVVQPELVAGRWPTEIESATHAPVVVVSERVASSFWPNASAIGQPLTDGGRAHLKETAVTFTVVGVVKEVRWAAWDERELPAIYGPYALLARQNDSAVLIRTAPGFSKVTEDALRMIGEADLLVRTSRVASMAQLFVDSVRPRRFRAWLFGSFAFASLFVAGLGIFGQLAMSTARRTREVGIRMACGATRGGIARLILREQLVPVVVGLLTGGLVAAWAVRFVKSYLYELTSSDMRVWTVAIALILITAAAGALVPALRASRVNPTQALQSD